MEPRDIAKRLSQARIAKGVDLSALARHIGVRQEHLRAIEDGRFGDLPAGIYGRAAIRTFAVAVGYDGAAILAACEPLLVPVEEPIAALARLRGCRVRRPEPLPPSRDTEFCVFEAPDAPPDWRYLPAAILDGAIVVGLLLTLIASALTLMTAPVSALERSAPAFAVMALLLAAAYYLCFGGVCGATVGARALGIESGAPARQALTVQAIGARSLRAATDDLRCIQLFGAWLGRSVRSWSSRPSDHAASI